MMKKRIFSLFMALTFCLTLLPAAALAAGPEDTGLCPHHLEHTETCGYIAPAEGAPCRHEHGPECYAETLDCRHVHDEACGCAVPAEGMPCRHEHTEECYTEALNCRHVHDETCGYVEAVPGRPCGYVCKVCPVQAMMNALPDEGEITGDNAEEVSAQLDAIDEAKAELTEEETDAVDFTRYQAAAAALLAQEGQAGANEPELLAEAAGDFTVEGGTPGDDYSYLDGVLTILTGTPLTISGTTTTDKIVVGDGDGDGDGVGANITFRDLSIRHSSADRCAFLIPGTASATITLEGSNTLQSGENCAGLAVVTGGAVTLRGDGALESTGGYNAAGIGGGHTFNAGTIRIESGTITAVGGYDGAGIGGGHSNDEEGNPYGRFDAIEITGGVIDARSPGNAAAIGTGCWAGTCPGSITIENAQVTAQTGGDHQRCAAIGRGISKYSYDYNCAVTIRNSIVSAQNVADKGNSISGANGTPDIQDSIVKVSAGSSCNGVYNGVYSVYGAYTLTESWTIPADASLFIDRGASLTIGDGATLTNRGTISHKGTLTIDGTFQNSGTMFIETGASLTITGGAALTNRGTISHKGTLTIDGTLQNSGTIQTAEGVVISGEIQGDPPETIPRVPYLTRAESGPSWTTGNCKLWTDVTSYETDWSEGWYVVTGEVTIFPRINVSGDVHLILADGCRLNADHGIHVGPENALTIYAQSEGDSMGSLTAVVTSMDFSNGEGAGIGGDSGERAGRITINGGNISASGYQGGWYSGPGIGGGRNGPSGKKGASGIIEIHGGTVTAKGGWEGPPGIGGWDNGENDSITITGGTVTAYGGKGNSNYGAGIGGGVGSAGGRVTITGGTVIAQGGNAESSGIGGGPGFGGTFITTGGNAVIIASSILGGKVSDEDKNSWSGVIFEGDTGKVYGAPITLTADAEIPTGKTLEIEAGKTLTIAEGVTLTNHGTITNNGTLDNKGVIKNYGTISGGDVSGAPVVGTFSKVDVTITQNSAPISSARYDTTVTLTANVAEAANVSLRNTVKNKVDFYLGGEDGTKLGTVVVSDNTASLELTLKGELWKPDVDNPRTFTAVYDGGDEWLRSTGTTILTIEKGTRTVTLPGTESVTSAVVVLRTAAIFPAAEDRIQYGYSTTAGETPGTWDWRYEPEFTDLFPETTYYFYARTVGTDYYEETISQPMAVTTASAQTSLPMDSFCLNDGSMTVESWNDKLLVRQNDAVYLLDKDTPVRVTGNDEMTPNTVTVMGADVDIILDNVNQGGEMWSGGCAPISVRDYANVTLKLEGENVLAGSGYYNQGISVQSGSTLTIEGPGSLKIGNENTYVGIGIGEMGEFGHVVVNSGTVDITAQEVGIGVEIMYGGEDAPSITINGGVVKTNVQYGRGVGIGAWYAMEGGVNITITGGSVELSGKGNKISAGGESSNPESSGSVTITGGSISGAPADHGISPAPTNGTNGTDTLIPVTIPTGKNETAVDALGIRDLTYGAPARTDGSGNLTLYLLPLEAGETQYTGTVIVDGDVQTFTIPAGESVTVIDAGVHVETPENTGKPEITPDGSIVLPGGSMVTQGESTIITIPEGGGTVTPNTEEGTITVSEGAAVKTGTGLEITIGDQGGTVGGDGSVTVPTGGSVQVGNNPAITLPDGGAADKDGKVTGGKVQIGDTTVIGSGTTVTPAGEVTVPNGGTVQTGGGPAITLLSGGTIDTTGAVKVPGDGSIQVGGTTIIFPTDGGEVKPNEDGSVIVPGGSKAQTEGGGFFEIPAGGLITFNGEVKRFFTVTFVPQNGSAEFSRTVVEGEKAEKPDDPVRSNYTFGGWYMEPACTTVWNSDTVVSDNLTLYAKWTADSSGAGSSGGSHGGYTPKPTVTVGGDKNGGTVKTTSNSVTIIPKNGYKAVKVTVNGKEVPVPADGRLTGLKASDKVDVTFGKVSGYVSVSQRFIDVAANAWYEEAIQFAVDNGLFNGTTETTFSPDSTMSRGMLAAVLYRMAGQPAVGASNAFTDVAAGKYYADAIAWASANGIVGGYGNGIFGPDDPITREQLAVMLWRYAGSPAATESELHFADIGEAGAFSKEALKWAAENGILNGYGDGRLYPKGLATRAQAAAMLMRYTKDTQK